MTAPLRFVWYVIGEASGSDWPQLFADKESAERHARELFPLEHPARREARVMYRKITQPQKETS